MSMEPGIKEASQQDTGPPLEDRAHGACEDYDDIALDAHFNQPRGGSVVFHKSNSNEPRSRRKEVEEATYVNFNTGTDSETPGATIEANDESPPDYLSPKKGRNFYLSFASLSEPSLPAENDSTDYVIAGTAEGQPLRDLSPNELKLPDKDPINRVYDEYSDVELDTHDRDGQFEGFVFQKRKSYNFQRQKKIVGEEYVEEAYEKKTEVEARANDLQQQKAVEVDYEEASKKKTGVETKSDDLHSRQKILGEDYVKEAYVEDAETKVRPDNLKRRPDEVKVYVEEAYATEILQCDVEKIEEAYAGLGSGESSLHATRSQLDRKNSTAGDYLSPSRHRNMYFTIGPDIVPSQSEENESARHEAGYATVGEMQSVIQEAIYPRAPDLPQRNSPIPSRGGRDRAVLGGESTGPLGLRWFGRKTTKTVRKSRAKKRMLATAGGLLIILVLIGILFYLQMNSNGQPTSNSGDVSGLMTTQSTGTTVKSVTYPEHETTEYEETTTNFHSETTAASQVVRPNMTSKLMELLERFEQEADSLTNTSETVKEILGYFQSSSFTSTDSSRWAASARKDGKRLQGIALSYVTGVIHDSTAKNELLYKVHATNTIYAIASTFDGTSNQTNHWKTVLKNSVMPMLESLFDHARRITNVTIVERSVYLCYDLFRLGLCYNYVGDFLAMLERNKQAIAVIEGGLGINRAKLYTVYAASLYNAGISNYFLGRRSEARGYFQKAADAYRSATDIDSESERERYIHLALNFAAKLS